MTRSNLFVRKRSFLSELGRNNRLTTIIMITGAFSLIFGICPLIGYLFHRYAPGNPFDFTDPDYFEFIAVGLLICFFLSIAATLVGTCCIYLILFARYLKAINRSTYLPLMKEEIETAGITDIRSYVTYVYNQLIYINPWGEDNPWEEDSCQYKIYSSPELHEDIQDAMESYFGKNTDIDISLVLNNLFDYYRSFVGKTMTDKTWKHLCEIHTDYISGISFAEPVDE